MASPSDSRPAKVAFGPFEFNPVSGELRKNGYKVKLPGQPEEILRALITHPGEVVTRDDLRIRLWPGMDSGNFEHGLNAAINKLRQVLGDVATEPRYIETLPGRGYVFVAPVSSANGVILELVPPRAVLLPEPQAMWRRFGPWAAAGTALAALLVFWVAHQRSPVSLKAARLLVFPPKGYYLEAGGIRQSFALSPNGERIAFTAKDTTGAFRVFFRDFSEPDSHPLADSDGGYSVVWSPDGQSLYFTSKGKLRRVDVNASLSQVVSDSTPYLSSAIPFGSGRLLLCNHRSCGLIPSSGGPLEAIDQWYSWAQLLPGGQHFLYTVDDPQLGWMRARIAATGGTEQGVEVVQSDSRVQYTGSLHSDDGYLVYLRGGTLLAQPFDLDGRRVTGDDPKVIARHVASFGYSGAADFSVSARGVLAYQTFASRSQFIWVDRTGARLSAASPPDIEASYLRLSPNGRSLATVAFDVERGTTDIWLYDANTPETGRKAISGPGISHIPVWSPDSRRLVYLWDRGWPTLALSSVDGTPDPEPLPSTGFMTPTDWSSDNRFILYTNSALPAITQNFPSDVFAIDMERGRRVIPLLTTKFFESNAVFSSDGKWLAFLSNESGKSEIYVQAIDYSDDSIRVTGERFLISRQGAQCLRWRKDKTELFYLGYDGQVYSVKLTFRSSTVHAGTPQGLFTIDAEARSTVHSVVSFDVSGDGSRFVIPSITSGEPSALVVVQDWESQVPKL